VITHLLDTNSVIGLLARKSEKIAAKLMTFPPGSLALPTIVAHELYFGAYKSARVAFNLNALRLFTGDVPVLDFDERDAIFSGELRALLATQGTPIGPYDVLIAGQAKARGMTVVTSNVAEFKRVVGLSVEDWTR
jgi:tRNA(fMet)-specific endonuclease VapC